MIMMIVKQTKTVYNTIAISREVCLWGTLASEFCSVTDILGLEYERAISYGIQRADTAIQEFKTTRFRTTDQYWSVGRRNRPSNVGALTVWLEEVWDKFRFSSLWQKINLKFSFFFLWDQQIFIFRGDQTFGLHVVVVVVGNKSRN